MRYRDPRDGRAVIGKSIGVLDIIRETNRSLHHDDDEFYRVPETQRGLFDALFMFENAGPEQLRRLVTNDFKKAVLTYSVVFMDAQAYAPLSDHIRVGLDKYVGNLATVRPTGSVFTLLSVVGMLIADMLRSFSIAFVAITLMMVALLRELKLGVIAMIPNLLPVAMILGTMGFGGVPIDMANILIASIILGLAVDDTIHFLHHYKHARQRLGDTEQAIVMALNQGGRAIVSTSIILAAGFLVYTSATMLNLVRFGWLIALSIVYALVIDLVVGPALLRLLYPQDDTHQNTETNPEHAR